MNSKKHIINGIVIGVIVIIAVFGFFKLAYANYNTYWSSSLYSAGNAACTSIGRTCVSSKTLSDTAIACSTASFGGSAVCGDTTTGYATWVSAKYTSGGAACAALGMTCSTSYNLPGTASGSCTGATNGGNALCSDTVTSGVTWAYSTTGTAACSGGRFCISSYDWPGNTITCSTTT